MNVALAPAIRAPIGAILANISALHRREASDLVEMGAARSGRRIVPPHAHTAAPPPSQRETSRREAVMDFACFLEGIEDPGSLGVPAAWAERFLCSPNLWRTIQAARLAWAKAGGTAARFRSEGPAPVQENPHFPRATIDMPPPMRAAWDRLTAATKAGRADVRRRLQAKELCAFGCDGPRGSWSPIPAGVIERIPRLAAPTWSDGRRANYFHVRVLDMEGLPFGQAARAYGPERLVNQLETLELGGNAGAQVAATWRGAGTAAPVSTDALLQELHQALCQQLEAGRFEILERGMPPSMDDMERRSGLVLQPIPLRNPATERPTAGGEAPKRRAEHECKEWLIVEWPLFPTRSKPDWQEVALQKWAPSLTGEGFLRAWDQAKKKLPKMGDQGRKKGAGAEREKN
jgi:hypothetical protein